MIKDSDNPSKAFADFLDCADYISSSEEKMVEAYFTASKIQVLEKEYDDLVDGILNKLVSKHLDKKEFYLELWKNVMESDLLFEEEEKKIYALYRIWVDGRIPYFQIGDGIKMSDDEFKQLVSDTEEFLHEIMFIMNCKFEQKTERSSLLMNVLKKCKNEKEQAVLLAQIISISELKAGRMRT